MVVEIRGQQLERLVLPLKLALPRFVWLSRCEQQAFAKQAELGAAVHGSLEQLQLSDLPIGLTVASVNFLPEIKVQIVPPSVEAAAMLFRAPVAFGQITV